MSSTTRTGSAPAERRQLSPPARVESATRRPGELDFWVLERGGWWGRVRSPDGSQTWVRAASLRRTGDTGSCPRDPPYCCHPRLALSFTGELATSPLAHLPRERPWRCFTAERRWKIQRKL